MRSGAGDRTAAGLTDSRGGAVAGSALLRMARLAGNYSLTHAKLHDQRVNRSSRELANKKKTISVRLGQARCLASLGNEPDPT